MDERTELVVALEAVSVGSVEGFNAWFNTLIQEEKSRLLAIMGLPDPPSGKCLKGWFGE